MGYRPRGRGSHQRDAAVLSAALARVFLPLLLLGVIAFAAGSGAPLLSSAAWWLINTTPPDITLTAPASPVRGAARFSVRLEPADRASVVQVWLDDRAIPPAEDLVVETSTLPDGPHRLVVVAADHSRLRNSSQQVVVFESDNTPPRLDVRLTPAALEEGRTTVLHVSVNEAARLVGRLGNHDLMWQGGQTERWTVLGIPPDPLFDELVLELVAEDEAGNVGVWEQRLAVRPTVFPAETLEMPPHLAGLISPELRQREMAQLQAIFAQDAGPARWRGRFIMPVEGPLTTLFGTERSFVGGYPGEQHPGLDIAAPLGARVVAPADGRVAFVGTLELRGNTVVLDHGAGVFTTYGHLAEARVQADIQVRQGELIGLVGSSGFSTGPHLHWELWVGGANVDPLEWTERDIP